MEIIINQIEATKLNLNPSDTLIVKVKGNEFENSENTASLQLALKSLFAFNEVMVIYLPKDHEIDLTVAKIDLEPVNNYCNDCNCGKKEENEQL